MNNDSDDHVTNTIPGNQTEPEAETQAISLPDAVAGAVSRRPSYPLGDEEPVPLLSDAIIDVGHNTISESPRGNDGGLSTETVNFDCVEIDKTSSPKSKSHSNTTGAPNMAHENEKSISDVTVLQKQLAQISEQITNLTRLQNVNKEHRHCHCKEDMRPAPDSVHKDRYKSKHHQAFRRLGATGCSK